MKNIRFSAVNILSLFWLSFFLFSCKFESNRIYFANNFDDVNVWVDKNTLTDAMSHSGKYCSVVNPSSPYGSVFRAKFRELSDKKIKKVRVSFYAYEMDSVSNGSMVFEVRNKNNKPIFWQGIKVFEMVVPKKWSIISQEFDISQELFKPEDEVWIYPWSQGTSSTFFDDYLIEFYVKNPSEK